MLQMKEEKKIIWKISLGMPGNITFGLSKMPKYLLHLLDETYYVE